MPICPGATACSRFMFPLLLGLAVACGDDTSAPPPSKPVHTIVYEEVSGDVGRIVQVKSDGSERLVRWEGNSNFGYVFAVAPDGRVLFRDGDDWWLLPAGTGPAAPFTPPAGASGFFMPAPVWSPDGAAIAWVVQWSGGFGLGIAAPGDAAASIITGDSIQVFNMAWSPDGTQLAFGANVGSPGFWAIARDGTGLHRLTPESFWVATMPQWSHSGQKISFIAGQVYTVAPDGTNMLSLTSNGSFAEAAYWSSDDRALITVGSGPADLSAVGAADGAHRALGLLWPETDPWSPDSELILYAGGTNGNPMSRIGVAWSDGRDPVLITPDSIRVAAVAWLPDAE